MQIRQHTSAQGAVDKPAIILHPSGTVITFDELETSANRLAHYFRQAGLVEGDAVAILMENNEHIHAVMWAARRAGLYYVPINTHLTAPEAAYIIDNSAAKAMIGSAALRKTCENLAEQLPDGLPALLMIAGPDVSDLEGWAPYPECVADQPDTPIDDEVEGDLLQYSSGTTGRPKGIKRELPHVSPAEAPGMMSALVGFWMHPDAVYLSPAPLYHTAPSVWSMTVQAGGITTVVLEKFDPEGCLDAIQRHRVTHGQFVPVMFTRMLKLPEAKRNSFDLSSLERVMHAAAPCPVEIKKQMIDWWGPIVDEYYASSEAIGSTLISAEEWLAHPGSVGKPMMCQLHILDEDGNELPPGQPGEIYFEGGFSFEYLNDTAKTAASRDKHGWTTVGDVGYVDEDGYLFLTDRRVRRRAGHLAARAVGALQVSAVDLVRGAAAAYRHRKNVQTRTGQEVFGVTLRVVDVSEPDSALDSALLGVPVVAVGSLAGASEFWLQQATFTLTEDDTDDRRVITVASIDAALSDLTARAERWPIAAATCDDVLRSVDPAGPALSGVVTESLAYSTLQAGPEFARWLADRGPAVMPDIADPVQANRDGDTLRIAFNRPQRHNAFPTDARAALLEALAVAQLDSSVAEVVLTGNGPSFCSGGDLDEFGTFADPASAHLARTRYSPALALDAVTTRLGPACRAEVHGQVLGSGLEMAAFCGRIVAAPDSVFGLPELSLGLLPGAGGTVSVTRRIGRWRTAYLVLSGLSIDADTAVTWGLADARS